jgi:hypothetical protein
MTARRWLVLCLCLPMAACYEEPVRDHLHLRFAPGEITIVTAVREIGSPDRAGDNTAVADRMDEARSNLDAGWDRWSRGFPDLDAIAERTTIERLEGLARRGIHSALLGDIRRLERFLGSQGLGAHFDDDGTRRELQLYPTGAGTATRQQRDRLDRAIISWSEDVAAYLDAATALYAHLDRAPHRAPACFAHVFDIDAEAAGPLDPAEEPLVIEVKRTMEDVAAVLLIDSDRAYSLNELAGLVFDTFEGRLTIAVDGPAIEFDGFVEHDGFFERPPVDLWSALKNLADLWISPDLVTELVRPGPADIQPEPNPRVFAARPRRWAPPPDPGVVESELRARLHPEPVYRLRWRTTPVPDDDLDALEFGLGLLADAERDLPTLTTP